MILTYSGRSARRLSAPWFSLNTANTCSQAPPLRLDITLTMQWILSLNSNSEMIVNCHTPRMQRATDQVSSAFIEGNQIKSLHF